MTFQELKNLLILSGVPKRTYSLPRGDRIAHADTYGEIRKMPDGKFEVSTVERAVRYDCELFESESAACMHFLKSSGYWINYPRIAEVVQAAA
ncbi:MAG: hypothetical protein FWE41_08900 [Coriobacteriia bacterium]|nr:hypothetical protein [Coriobacteriia bacterium]MCL2537514.1 hypothetical protein [Coriobacteriia bacterium]